MTSAPETASAGAPAAGTPAAGTPAAGTPAAEHTIDEALVRCLVRRQHPELAALPLRHLDHGWDNVMFRLGEEWVVRLPRRLSAVALIRHEQTWLPRLAPHLDLPIPVPQRVGRPGCGYPWPWSVVRWMPGRTADQTPPVAAQARRWGEFLVSLHRDAPTTAPVNGVRGVPLAARRDDVEQRLAQLRCTDATPEVHDVWRRALAAPPSTERRWLHGDLHPRNVLVESGRFVGVIDWGDLTAGDVATDLASFWMLFENPRARREGFTSYGATAEQRTRAKGWAVLFGAFLLASGSVDHAAHAAVGRHILRRLTTDG